MEIVELQTRAGVKYRIEKLGDRYRVWFWDTAFIDDGKAVFTGDWAILDDPAASPRAPASFGSVDAARAAAWEVADAIGRFDWTDGTGPKPEPKPKPPEPKPKPPEPEPEPKPKPKPEPEPEPESSSAGWLLAGAALLLALLTR